MIEHNDLSANFTAPTPTGIPALDGTMASKYLDKYIHPHTKLKIHPNGKVENGKVWQNNMGYKQIVIGDKIFSLHKVVWTLYGNEPQKNLHIDHIDGNRQNNNISNLRLLSNRENNWRSKKGSSKYPGVSKKGKKWYCSVWYDRKNRNLGIYDTEIEAFQKYIGYLDTVGERTEFFKEIFQKETLI